MKLVMSVLVEIHRDTKVSDVESLKEELTEYISDFWRKTTRPADNYLLSVPRFTFGKE